MQYCDFKYFRLGTMLLQVAHGVNTRIVVTQLSVTILPHTWLLKQQAA